MAKSVKAFINPTMLTWAREQAGYSLADAAHKLGIDEPRLQALEDDQETPTFAKLLDMADLYKRPVSLFYLKKPPKGWQPIQDFRRLPGSEGTFSPQLTYTIRQARERREVALAVKNELNEPVREFTLRATLATNVETLGARIREFLEVNEAKQQRFAKKAFEGWRAAIEAKDILVFVVPRLKVKEMRGTALAESTLPVILVNGKD